MQYFYDSQVRRFVQQFAAIFSHVDVQFGSDPQGNPILHRVPVVFGNASRQAATVVNNNSSNTLLSAPLISIYIAGLEYDQRRTQEPNFQDKSTVRQRYFNQETGQFETTQGNAFTVHRLMPVPYTLRLSVDIWATSEQQRLEIIEQLGILFNPSLEIRSNDNFVDWTNLSVVYQDGLTYNSKTIPQGTSNSIEVTNWKFWMPIWISGPIKVTKLGIIQKIISTIHKGSTLVDIENEDLLLGTRQKITPYGYQLLLSGSKLQILPASQPGSDNNNFNNITGGPDTSIYWSSILNMYGKVRPGVSQIALENEYMSTEIIGTIDFDPDDDRLLTFTIDPETLPQNTLTAVDSVIDPILKFPGNGLPAAATDQRYLIVKDIPRQRLYDTIGLRGLINGTTLTVTGIVGGSGTNLENPINMSITGTGVATGTYITAVNEETAVGYINGNTLTIIPPGPVLQVGMTISGPGIASDTYIVSYNSFTYTLSTTSLTAIGDGTIEFLGYFDGTRLTVVEMISGELIPGVELSGGGLPVSTLIVSQIGGTYGAEGVYEIEAPNGIPSPGTVSFSGFIKDDLLTVATITSGTATISVGMAISGSFVADGTVVTAVVTGSGGVGTYRVSISQNIGSVNRAKSFSAVDNTPITLYGSGITIRAKSYTLNNSSTASGRLNGVITYPSNWVGLTEGASANDIIQYGTINNVVSTEFNPSGTATLLLKDVAGVVEGAVVTFATNGGAVGTVISVDYNTKQIVIDTPITVDFPNNTQLRFTADGWFIDYENNSTGMEEYVVNSNTGIQYRNNNGIWRQSYTGYYDQGQWRVII